MKILYITTRDVPGQQFNGVLLKEKLTQMGHDVHISLHKSIINRNETVDPALHVEGNGFTNIADRFLRQAEKLLSVHSLLPVQSSTLFSKSYYQEADAVHLQLPHTASWFRLSQVRKMSKDRKIFWTMHDPWLMTGHCVHPLDCERWKTGCGACPYLDIPFSISYDNTALIWRLKDSILQHSNLHLIAASQWMREKVQESPLLNRFPCSVIPFGIDFEIFKPMDKQKCREVLGIPAGADVMAFRHDRRDGFKGVRYIAEALQNYKPKRPTILISIGGYTRLEELDGKIKILQLGMLEQPALVSAVLNAADIFLSPSIAEAFGMMPIEAMACRTPVIAFEGTALPGVIGAPEGGMIVPCRDSDALGAAIGELLENKPKHRKIAQTGLEIVRELYPLDLYIQRHLDLYAAA